MTQAGVSSGPEARVRGSRQLPIALATLAACCALPGAACKEEAVRPTAVVTAADHSMRIVK